MGPVIALCSGLLVAGIYPLVVFLHRKKRMRDLDVNDVDRRSFEQESQGEHARHFENITITETWVCEKSTLGTALFPLKEIAFFEKGDNIYRYDIVYHVALMFKDGGEVKLPCPHEQQDEILAVLEERCPQANQWPYGTFL